MTATAPSSKAARHARIVALIRDVPVRSQAELADLLAAEGFVTTQATLSRDLEELGAIKVRGTDGSAPVYVIPEEGAGPLRAAAAARTSLAVAAVAAGEGLPQLAGDRGLHRGGGRLHVLPQVLQLAEDLLTADTELLRELVHAGLASHCSPCSSEAGGGTRSTSRPVEARSWCDLHDWLMTGRPCSLPCRARVGPGPRTARPGTFAPGRSRAAPPRARRAGTLHGDRLGRGTPERDATRHHVRGAVDVGQG